MSQFSSAQAGLNKQVVQHVEAVESRLAALEAQVTDNLDRLTEIASERQLPELPTPQMDEERIRELIDEAIADKLKYLAVNEDTSPTIPPAEEESPGIGDQMMDLDSNVGAMIKYLDTKVKHLRNKFKDFTIDFS